MTLLCTAHLELGIKVAAGSLRPALEDFACSSISIDVSGRFAARTKDLQTIELWANAYGGDERRGMTATSFEPKPATQGPWAFASVKADAGRPTRFPGSTSGRCMV